MDATPTANPAPMTAAESAELDKQISRHFNRIILKKVAKTAATMLVATVVVKGIEKALDSRETTETTLTEN